MILCFFAFVSDAIKIDSITSSILTSNSESPVFVEIKSGGLKGWGQAYYNSEQSDLMSTVQDKIHLWVAPVMFGQDFSTPDDIAAFAEAVWRKNYKHTGTTLAQSLAGVDTALWDLLARSQNVSVCALIAKEFGNTCRKQVPVYGSNGSRKKSAKDIVSNAVANRDKYGVKAFKFQIAQRMGGDRDIKPNRTEELIPLARQQLGPDVTLMVDANGGYDNFTHASQVAQLLIEHNYTWFEEPFPFWDYDQVAALAKEVNPSLGLALGEQEYRLDVWERNIKAMNYAQPDVHYIGGVSRTLRVAKMSIAANTTFVPHSPNPSM
jgi:L-alanine-DL-glutamate epimerase-like enolase superfamily enzyme